MELPNLWPQLWDLDLIVAPSHYAALHFSVQDAVHNLPVERRPHVAVVTPGVDATIYGNVDSGVPRRVFSGKCELARGLGSAPTQRAARRRAKLSGFLARLSPEKSPGLLVHAASIILNARPLARVVFVGDGAARHMCEELARAYGIENRVIFVGAVYGAENVASRTTLVSTSSCSRRCGLGRDVLYCKFGGHGFI